MARYASVADLAAIASWSRLAEAAGKDDLRHDDDRLISAADIQAAAENGGVGINSPVFRAMARLNRALEDSCAIVDASILARYPGYAQPARAGQAPTPVTVWVVDLALERLLGAGQNEERMRRADAAREQLAAIATGRMDLPGDLDGDGVDDDGGVRPRVARATPILTAESLRPFTAVARPRGGYGLAGARR